jgi:hypothetical protein
MEKVIIESEEEVESLLDDSNKERLIIYDETRIQSSSKIITIIINRGKRYFRPGIITFILLLLLLWIVRYYRILYRYHEEDILPPVPQEENELHCTLVSSRGLLKSCDVHDLNPISSHNELYKYDWKQLRDGSTVYVTTEAISNFAKYVMNTIEANFILISGDSDLSVWEDIFPNETSFHQFINHPRLLRWYAQNMVTNHPHPKLFHLPIGLDYHSRQDIIRNEIDMSTPIRIEAAIQTIRASSKPWSERLCQAYADFQFKLYTKYGQDRKDAIKFLPSESVYYERVRVTRTQGYKHQVEYAFVISPFGNGYDCHRTWEALVLGCIPIIHSSGLNSLYEGLPVLIVNDWSEVTVDLMSRTIKNFSNRSFQYDKLTLKYWTEIISNKHNNNFR